METGSERVSESEEQEKEKKKKKRKKRLNDNSMLNLTSATITGRYGSPNRRRRYASGTTPQPSVFFYLDTPKLVAVSMVALNTRGDLEAPS